MKYVAQVGDNSYEIEIDDNGAVRLDGQLLQASLLQVGPLGLYSLLIENRSRELVVEETPQGYRVTLGSRTFHVRVADERELRLAGSRTGPVASTGEVHLKAPIPGMVVRVLVRGGEAVTPGQPLVILEAMKMENELRAPRAGTVSDVKVKAGERVEQGAVLLVLH
ncbi:MAG: acetyl-CoA carboxylase biotin carboxyl carrier protein subunit [Anaerolineae bacterium]|nr:acetyl-CoA carboxylase biotin carboxyl carrier protein subunit [Caldilineales bacterium]MCX7851210.1 acetyl-CoA carboxylase biotin carboxyl carrier protein subunit [Caldilineales bacterium]MDW8269125.1 acetyl-CoA carboxylase biotin carboxyl carrier protein subunit [Anaerolineae bacterium]